MAFETDGLQSDFKDVKNPGLDILKPEPKKVNDKLDFIGKIRSDLNRLVAAKKSMEAYMKERGVGTDDIHESLIQLNKSIGVLQNKVEEYENNSKN